MIIRHFFSAGEDRTLVGIECVIENLVFLGFPVFLDVSRIRARRGGGGQAFLVGLSGQ